MKMNTIPYGKVVRKTWRKERFKALKDIDKLICLYFWSHPDGSNPAFVVLSHETMSLDLGIDLRTSRAHLNTLCKDGWFIFTSGVPYLYLPQWFFYTPPMNSSMVWMHLRAASALPECAVKERYLNDLQQFVEKYELPGEAHRLAEGVGHSVTQGVLHSVGHCRAHKENEKENEKEKENGIVEIEQENKKKKKTRKTTIWGFEAIEDEFGHIFNNQGVEVKGMRKGFRYPNYPVIEEMRETHFIDWDSRYPDDTRGPLLLNKDLDKC